MLQINGGAIMTRIKLTELLCGAFQSFQDGSTKLSKLQIIAQTWDVSWSTLNYDWETHFKVAIAQLNTKTQYNESPESFSLHNTTGNSPHAVRHNHRILSTSCHFMNAINFPGFNTDATRFRAWRVVRVVPTWRTWYVVASANSILRFRLGRA